MNILISSLLFLVGGMACAMAQDTTLLSLQTASPVSAPYFVHAQLGGGLNYDLSDFTGRPGLTVNRNQFFTYAQLRWLPGNLLTGALEVGYLNFYSVTASTGATSVRSAIPISIVFSMMPITNLEIAGGFGLGILSSRVSGAVGQAHSTSYSMLTMGTITYLIPVYADLSIGLEGRVTYMDFYDDKVLGVGAVIRYKLLQY